MQERSKHELAMAREKSELDMQKTKATLERSLLATEDRLKESQLSAEMLREKVDKLMHQLQEQGHTAKRETDAQDKRNEDIVTNFERQVRELRSQLSMKNKDIANFREEVADLE